MPALPHATEEQAARAIAHVSCVLLAAKNGNQHNENMVVLMDQATAMFQRITVLEEALKPFADEANYWADIWPNDFTPVLTGAECCDECGHANVEPERSKFTIGDLRKARAALSKAEGK